MTQKRDKAVQDTEPDRAGDFRNTHSALCKGSMKQQQKYAYTNREEGTRGGLLPFGGAWAEA